MEDFWLYVSMPFICAAVGYGTNWLCIKMMCYPINFIGIKPPYLGWQGIVPRRAEHIAGIQVDLITTRLISVEEIFSRLEPKGITHHLEPVMLDMIEEITDEVMALQAPKMWEALPIAVKKRVYKRAKKEAPEIVGKMMEDIQGNIAELFDIKHMVMDAFTRDRGMLVRFFQDIGYKEFAFVQNSGLWFGFLFGVMQMVLWIFYESPWILPLAGVFVGFSTNWLALNMIFSPKYPVKVGPFTIHGLFIKRQEEVAVDLGLTIAGEILNPENIINGILKGPSSDKLFELIQKNVKLTMDDYVGYTKPFVAITMGTDRYLEIKDVAVNKIMNQMPDAMTHISSYSEEAMDINNVVRSRMSELSPEEFEGMLRPIFEQDEWKLLALGAVIGFMVGWFQLAYMFGEKLY